MFDGDINILLSGMVSSISMAGAENRSQGEYGFQIRDMQVVSFPHFPWKES